MLGHAVGALVLQAVAIRLQGEAGAGAIVARLSGDEFAIAREGADWRHPVRGYVSPGEFMPVVNTSALSERIANWVMQTACRQARAWRQQRAGRNLSPSQLQSGDLADSVAALLEAPGLTSSLLEIEVAEDILLDDERRALAIFKCIQELGVRVLFEISVPVTRA